MLGQVVVVLDGLEGRGLAVQAQVVDRDGAREEGLHGVDHAQPGAQDGHYGEGLGLDSCRLILEAEGCLVLRPCVSSLFLTHKAWDDDVDEPLGPELW